MTRTLFRRRPEVEALESVQLLSVAAGLAQHAVKAPQIHVDASRGPIQLIGTTTGEANVEADNKDVFRLSGEGSVNPLIYAWVSGTIVRVGNSDILGPLTLKDAYGTVYVTMKESAVSGPNGSRDYIYHITKGAGRWNGTSGEGLAKFSFVEDQRGTHGYFEIQWG